MQTCHPTHKIGDLVKQTRSVFKPNVFKTSGCGESTLTEHLSCQVILIDEGIYTTANSKLRKLSSHHL